VDDLIEGTPLLLFIYKVNRKNMPYDRIKKILRTQKSRPIAGHTAIPGLGIDLTTYASSPPDEYGKTNSPNIGPSESANMPSEYPGIGDVFRGSDMSRLTDQEYSDMSRLTDQEKALIGNPDSKGMINGYYYKDLQKQFDELKADPDQLKLAERYYNKMLDGTYILQDNAPPGVEEEAINFLGTAVKYGRRQNEQ
jgi:hypothetical protein